MTLHHVFVLPCTCTRSQLVGATHQVNRVNVCQHSIRRPIVRQGASHIHRLCHQRHGAPADGGPVVALLDQLIELAGLAGLIRAIEDIGFFDNDLLARQDDVVEPAETAVEPNPAAATRTATYWRARTMKSPCGRAVYST
jgi:hypothetical protein